MVALSKNQREIYIIHPKKKKKRERNIYKPPRKQKKSLNNYLLFSTSDLTFEARILCHTYMIKNINNN